MTKITEAVIELAEFSAAATAELAICQKECGEVSPSPKYESLKRQFSELGQTFRKSVETSIMTEEEATVAALKEFLSGLKRLRNR